MAFKSDVLLQERFFCCFFHPFLPRNGHRKNPATGNEHVRFGVWKFGVRDFKGLVSHYLAATKNIQAQEMRIWGLRICFRENSETCVPLSGRNRPTKNPPTGNENLGLGLVLGRFQGLASPYLAAASHQKIQPQEMRIWGLGLRICFREFSGTCAPSSGHKIVVGSFQGLASPYLAAAGRQKIQPQEMRI